MKLKDLEPHERLALAGLVRAMTRQDGVVSAEEATAVTMLANAVGAKEFWFAMNEAQLTLPDPGDVSKAAETVTRPDVRQWIYGWLEDLAGADEVVVAEEALLRWLHQLWELD
ncbi:MAG: hypothetical protein JJ863_22345 [Deltaproteobacteria bacterium]|nr:hypothetical protein [Deltaproteobacteria bacterium]